MVEEEIICLERKVEDLKFSLYQQRKQREEWDLQHQHQQWWQRHQKHFLCGLKGRRELGESPRFAHTEIRGQSLNTEINFSPRLAAEKKYPSWTKTKDKEVEHLHSYNEAVQSWRLTDRESSTDSPNKLSEQLIKLLISIFHKLNQSSDQLDWEEDDVPQLNISCISSKSLMSRSSFNSSKSPMYSLNYVQILDPYGVLPDGEVTARDIGTYKRLIHFTRSSLDISRITLCIPAIRRLRILMHKLCTAELCSLTYKQKLAFWINTYNGCIMHAFLQHGLPPSPDKLLELLKKAAVNVGGIVLNALAIEHFILRHSSGTKHRTIDEKGLLQHAYGLEYPEPNVTFALCRGSWSSPALRVYTAENVMNELERAKVEYLEASVGVTSKKKIVMPKLLHWHMRDFADDIESLIEWTYSQLARFGPLKRSIMECLSGDTRVTLLNMVEIQPYEAEFRYLLPY